ncbi:porin family protein [Vibrio vulnificus]|nr:porin family protein [Vibrio vulnificus]
MLKRFSLLSCILLLYVSSSAVANQILVTPFLGYTIGGSVEDENKKSFDLSPSATYAIALETPLDKGRVGLFYSYQNSEVDVIKHEYGFHYLHLQSSVYYPTDSGLNSYLGLGLGASYADVDWANDKVGFSASIFGGIEYPITSSLSISAQVRWLGTVVDNNSSTACVVPTTGQNCVIQFETDWVNQFQSNLGLTFKF